MNKRGFEFLQHCKNQFRNHWNLFIEEEMTLHQLELVCFAWVIQHEDLYRNRPLATEPIRNPKTSMVDFKMVMKAFVSGKTITYGRQQWRIENYVWSVLMFGTFSPTDNGIPRYKWVGIDEDRVPDVVKRLSIKQGEVR